MVLSVPSKGITRREDSTLPRWFREENTVARLSHVALVAATAVILLATGLEPVFAQAVFDINANKPAKVTWTPKRVVNDDLIPPEDPVQMVDVEMSTFAVTVSADKFVKDAQLWVSGSLAGVLSWPTEMFDIPGDARSL